MGGHYIPTWEWSAICVSCHQVFALDDAPLGVVQEFTPTEYTLTFPKGDASVVEATCPHCGERGAYDNAKLLRPQHIIDNETKSKRAVERLAELSKEIEDLKDENTKLEGQLNEAYQTLKQKDADISKFAEAFFQLGKRVSDESVSEQPNDQQKKQPQKKTTYEGTNPD